MRGDVQENEGMCPPEVVEVVYELDFGVEKLAGLPKAGSMVWLEFVLGVGVEDGSPL